MEGHYDVKLLPSFNNADFISWKLSEVFDCKRNARNLLKPVAQVQQNTFDKLIAKATALHNHLHQCGNDLFFFCESYKSGFVSLYQLSLESRVEHLIDLPKRIDVASQPLDCSISKASGCNTLEKNVYVSSTGTGDLIVLAPKTSILPDEWLRPSFATKNPSKLREISYIAHLKLGDSDKPFVIIDSFFTNEALNCIVWSIREKCGSERDSVCETYLVSLDANCITKGLNGQVHPNHYIVRKLLETKVPPHAACFDALRSELLIAADPTTAFLTPSYGVAIAPSYTACNEIDDSDSRAQNDGRNVGGDGRKDTTDGRAIGQYTRDSLYSRFVSAGPETTIDGAGGIVIVPSKTAAPRFNHAQGGKAAEGGDAGGGAHFAEGDRETRSLEWKAGRQASTSRHGEETRKSPSTSTGPLLPPSAFSTIEKLQGSPPVPCSGMKTNDDDRKNTKIKSDNDDTTTSVLKKAINPEVLDSSKGRLSSKRLLLDKSTKTSASAADSVVADDEGLSSDFAKRCLTQDSDSDSYSATKVAAAAAAQPPTAQGKEEHGGAEDDGLDDDDGDMDSDLIRLATERLKHMTSEKRHDNDMIESRSILTNMFDEDRPLASDVDEPVVDPQCVVFGFRTTFRDDTRRPGVEEANTAAAQDSGEDRQTVRAQERVGRMMRDSISDDSISAASSPTPSSHDAMKRDSGEAERGAGGLSDKEGLSVGNTKRSTNGDGVVWSAQWTVDCCPFHLISVWPNAGVAEFNVGHSQAGQKQPEAGQRKEALQNSEAAAVVRGVPSSLPSSSFKEDAEAEGTPPCTAMRGMYLGVAYDFDGALLEVGVPVDEQSRNDKTLPLANIAKAIGGATKKSSRQSGVSTVVNHISSAPALAYIWAGRSHRKALWVLPPWLQRAPTTKKAADGDAKGEAKREGSRPTHQPLRNPLSAVIVELQNYAFLYRAEKDDGGASDQRLHGQQQILELDLEAGELVLGCRIVFIEPPPAPSSSSCLKSKGTATATATALLFILTRRRVLRFDISEISNV